MRINFDRLSKLAGLPENNSKGSLHESKSYSEGEDHEAMGEMADIAYMNEEDEGEDHEGVDEMFEIDEVMLVQELRRAKRIMNENRRRAQLNESKKKQSSSKSKSNIDRFLKKNTR